MAFGTMVALFSLTGLLQPTIIDRVNENSKVEVIRERRFMLKISRDCMSIEK
jgi:hypothetical protein